MADAAGMMECRPAAETSGPTVCGPKKYIKGVEFVDWGVRNRLSRLIAEDGRCQFLPIDHGYFQGPTRCLECPGSTIEELYPYADALFVTRGVLRATAHPYIQPSRLWARLAALCARAGSL